MWQLLLKPWPMVGPWKKYKTQSCLKQYRLLFVELSMLFKLKVSLGRISVWWSCGKQGILSTTKHPRFPNKKKGEKKHVWCWPKGHCLSRWSVWAIPADVRFPLSSVLPIRPDWTEVPACNSIMGHFVSITKHSFGVRTKHCGVLRKFPSEIIVKLFFFPLTHIFQVIISWFHSSSPCVLGQMHTLWLCQASNWKTQQLNKTCMLHLEFCLGCVH